jgi:UDP-N-acetylmuramoylalanine--D-glutamate ligase
MKIKELKNKKILILGFGLEGKNTFAFLRKHFSQKELTVADVRDVRNPKFKNVKWILGDNYLSFIKDFDVIIKTPGIPLSKIKKFAPRSIITSQTQLFLDNCKGKIIGITGTKGKSTTASLIHHVFKKNKIKSYLIGNIENPALSYLDKKGVFVYEMSCHQLDGLKTSPHIAIFLNVFKEHLDYYSSFKSYFSAKSNIVIHQKKNDYFIFNPKFKLINNLNVKSKKILIKDYEDVFINNSWLLDITHKNNLIAVFQVCKLFIKDFEKIIKAIKTFKKLSHRLEYVGNYKGIEFYDDSISTIPESTIFALDTLGNNVETIILGGYDRGVNFKKLGQKIDKSNIKNIIFFPDSGERILKEIKEKINYCFVSSMEEAVKICFKETRKGKICLLSPASSSYNMFKNFKERGDLFKKYIYEKKK